MYSPDDLEEMTELALKGRSPDVYLEQAIDALVEFCLSSPTAWMQFGPYWPVVNNLVSDRVDTSAWEISLDQQRLLLRYRISDPVKAAVAALNYLEREGDYLPPNEAPHTIVLPNGEQALYVPGAGVQEAG